MVWKRKKSAENKEEICIYFVFEYIFCVEAQKFIFKLKKKQFEPNWKKWNKNK